MRFAEDAVGGAQRSQVKLFFGAGAQQFEEMVEHIGHQVPGGAGIETETVPLQGACAASDTGEPFEELDLVSFAGEEGRCGKAGDAAAHYYGPGAASHARGSNHVAATARAARPALKTSGTRTRDS